MDSPSTILRESKLAILFTKCILLNEGIIWTGYVTWKMRFIFCNTSDKGVENGHPVSISSHFLYASDLMCLTKLVFNMCVVPSLPYAMASVATLPLYF